MYYKWVLKCSVNFTFTRDGDIPAQVRLRLRNIGGGWKGMGGYVGPVLTGEDLDQVAKAGG